jgi:integrase
VVAAAGSPHRRLYNCRHTFATWAIESGIELWYLAELWARAGFRSRTPTRWLRRTDDQLRATFDGYDDSVAARSATS